MTSALSKPTELEPGRTILSVRRGDTHTYGAEASPQIGRVPRSRTRKAPRCPWWRRAVPMAGIHQQWPAEHPNRASGTPSPKTVTRAIRSETPVRWDTRRPRASALRTFPSSVGRASGSEWHRRSRPNRPVRVTPQPGRPTGRGWLPALATQRGGSPGLASQSRIARSRMPARWPRNRDGGARRSGCQLRPA